MTTAPETADRDKLQVNLQRLRSRLGRIEEDHTLIPADQWPEAVAEEHQSLISSIEQLQSELDEQQLSEQETRKAQEAEAAKAQDRERKQVARAEKRLPARVKEFLDAHDQFALRLTEMREVIMEMALRYIDHKAEFLGTRSRLIDDLELLYSKDRVPSGAVFREHLQDYHWPTPVETLLRHLEEHREAPAYFGFNSEEFAAGLRIFLNDLVDDPLNGHRDRVGLPKSVDRRLPQGNEQ